MDNLNPPSNPFSFNLPSRPHVQPHLKATTKDQTKEKSDLLIHVRSHTVQWFCKVVAMWKNLLPHPNVLDLTEIPGTLEDERCSMISEGMANGDIMKYVRSIAGDHLKLVSYNRVIRCHHLPTPVG